MLKVLFIKKNMSNFYKLFIFCLEVIIVTSMEEEININSGLSENNLIEWEGVISTKKSPALLYIFSTFSSRNDYSVMKMQIQGARNKLAFSAGRRGRESFKGREYMSCRLGKKVVAPDTPFRAIIRILPRELMVYWNGKLKFTLPITTSAQNIERISQIKIYGSAKTRELRILTDDHLAQELQDPQCGEITNGKTVPDFCPSTRSGCRIVGGGPAIPGQVPWQAAVRRKTITGNQDYHVCGSTLISECWALTSGHCFSSYALRNLKNYVLRVGDYYNKDNSPNSQNSKAEDSQDLEIEKVIRHQNFRLYPVHRNDIALVKLKKCATYSDFVKPACLPKSSTQKIDGSQTRCGVSGWGATNSTQDSSQFPACLQSASVHVKSVSFCKNAYQNNFIQSEMLCAGGFGCADTCQGDSGGPLICAFGAKPRYTLWGITSSGMGCGEERTPGVYTRVTSYIRWLYLNTKLSPNDFEFAELSQSGLISRYYCQHQQQS